MYHALLCCTVTDKPKEQSSGFVLYVTHCFVSPLHHCIIAAHCYVDSHPDVIYLDPGGRRENSEENEKEEEGRHISHSKYLGVGQYSASNYNIFLSPLLTCSVLSHAGRIWI